MSKLSPRDQTSWSDVATVNISSNIFPARHGISHPRHVVTSSTKSNNGGGDVPVPDLRFAAVSGGYL